MMKWRDPPRDIGGVTHRIPDGSPRRKRSDLDWDIESAARDGRMISAAELDEILMLSRPQDAAWLVYHAMQDGTLAPGVLAGAMWDLWQFSYPDGPDRDGWIEMFRAAGYTSNGKPAALPEAPVTLYRAAWDDVADGRYGMSWTPGSAGIRYYALIDVRDGISRPVWEAEFPPERLLCSNTVYGEYVADATGLDVREAAPAGAIDSPVTAAFRALGLS